MKPGDLVNLYFEGEGSRFGETVFGLVLSCFIDHSAKERCDNSSRWITGCILADGRVRIFDLYWDDDYEVLS